MATTVPSTATGKRLEAGALRTQAKRLLERAEELERLAEQGQVVLVGFSAKGNSYAYRLPGDMSRPKVGEWVVVPPSPWQREPSIGRVTGYGRGGYLGPLSEVLGLVVWLGEEGAEW